MRELLRRLADAGDLVTVSRPVDPVFELAAVTERIQATSNQAVLFTDVGGARIPVVSNVYGSPHRLGALVGANDRGFPRAFAAITSGAIRPPPWPEGPAGHPHHGGLADLPLPRYFADDGGAYLTGGVFLARDPDTRVANLSFHRAMYVGDGELRVRLAPGHHLTRYHEAAERRGDALDAAILLGVAPALFLAAAARLPYEASELDLAATLAGRPLPSRPGRTIGLEIPLDADIVIEGRFRPGVRRPEGPFGEFMGYYVDVADNAVFDVSDVSWRDGAVLHSINCGSSEEVLPLGVLAAAETYRRLVARVDGVVDVVRHPRVNLDVVSVTQHDAGHASRVLRELLTIPHARMCAVVDDDIDIYDLTDVLWALLTRGSPEELTRRAAVRSFEHDPQARWGRFAANACVPFAERHAWRRKHTPGAADLDLAAYVDRRQ
jgi:3-polyprenyl-4-hydroxybenzoate decarboxylase